MKFKVVSDNNIFLQATVILAVDYDHIGTARLQFQKRLVTNDVFKCILARCSVLNEIMVEVTKNSFDSFVDRLDSQIVDGKIHLLNLKLEVFYRKDEFVIAVTDNGKPITFSENGQPINRDRQKRKHFGYKHIGIYQSQRLLRTIDGKISWQALKDGTRTEVRIPATSSIFSR
ncbi:MAG: hypothetical protein WCH76_03450 [Candidatus Riflemargulisbacteria bacterium]